MLPWECYDSPGCPLNPQVLTLPNLVSVIVFALSQEKDFIAFSTAWDWVSLGVIIDNKHKNVMASLMNTNGNKLTNYRVGKQIIDMNIKIVTTAMLEYYTKERKFSWL